MKHPDSFHAVESIRLRDDLSAFLGTFGGGEVEFEADIDADVRLKRLDTGESVDVVYDPSGIKGDPRQQELMQKFMQGPATPEDKKHFGGI